MERIISRHIALTVEEAGKQEKQFVEELSKLTLREAEQIIAERNFRKPIVIGPFEIRPFWKDLRETPPLPVKTTRTW